MASVLGLTLPKQQLCVTCVCQGAQSARDFQTGEKAGLAQLLTLPKKPLTQILK